MRKNWDTLCSTNPTEQLWRINGLVNMQETTEERLTRGKHCAVSDGENHVLNEPWVDSAARQNGDPGWMCLQNK